MKVLVVGSGGREHVLCWKLKQSRGVEKVYCAPGNAGIAQDAECVNIKVDELDKLADFAEREKIDFTVVGPEAPLILKFWKLHCHSGLDLEHFVEKTGIVLNNGEVEQ